MTKRTADPLDRPSKRAKLEEEETTTTDATTSSNGEGDAGIATPPLPGTSQESSATESKAEPKKKKATNKKAAAKKTEPKSTTKVAKAPRKSRAKESATVLDPEPEEPAAPKPKRINKIIKAKIQTIQDFNNNTDESSILRTSAKNPEHIIVSKLALTAALMTMRADYDMFDPSLAILADVSDIIVSQFDERIGLHRILAPHVVLNMSRQSVFEESIQQKIAGWGLEDVKLLRVELEMGERERERGAGKGLIKYLEGFDEVEATFVDEAKELKGFGVCVAPAAVFV